MAPISVQMAFSRPPTWAQIQGVSAAGGCVISEAAVNDLVVGVFNMKTGASEASNFETKVSVAGQIKQTSATDLSGNQYWAALFPQS
jgi:hypothetical protein